MRITSLGQVTYLPVMLEIDEACDSLSARKKAVRSTRKSFDQKKNMFFHDTGNDLKAQAGQVFYMTIPTQDEQGHALQQI